MLSSRPPRNAALELAQGKGRPWLVLLGSKGWGKTHLASAVVNYRIEHPELAPGKFATAPDILGELRASYDSDTYEQVQDMYKTAPLLVIDDLGTEYRKSTGGGLSWTEEQLYQIVDYRYRERLETVVTSNTDMESLDERIADRLLDVGSGAVVTCNLVLPSYRSGKILNG